MKTFNIKTINLKIYYLVIFVALTLGMLFSSIIAFLVKGILQVNFLIFLGITMTIVFLLMNFCKKFFKQKIIISINNKSIKFKAKEEKVVLFKDVKSYKLKTLMNNFPTFKMKLINGETIKFRCEHSLNEMDDFIRELDKLVSSNK
ncbi:MAG: hypothetical protein HRT69_09020 [Flavobacteriaceae bacterium]|nr:hypothetical protein [Flavobacteriaceae bacterium]